jgi:hypothetical protein
MPLKRRDKTGARRIGPQANRGYARDSGRARIAADTAEMQFRLSAALRAGPPPPRMPGADELKLSTFPGRLAVTAL